MKENDEKIKKEYVAPQIQVLDFEMDGKLLDASPNTEIEDDYP